MGRTGWLAVLALAVVTIAAHASSLGGGFVYDDHRFIEHNAAIRTVPLVAAFRDPDTASHREGIQNDIYRPLRTILFSLEYQLFARTAPDGSIAFHLGWWHALSILLHMLNTILVFRLLLTLLRGAVVPAALGAAVFGVHPVTSECVAWLSSQGDLLAMTLLLGALIVMERPGKMRTVGGTVCFFAACLAKESALMLPLLLPLRDACLPRAIPGEPAARALTTMRTSWVRVGLLAMAACFYFVLRQSVLPTLQQVPHPDGSVLATARGMLHGLGWYVQGLVLPLGFPFDTRIDVPLRWSDPEVWIGMGILGSLLVAGLVGLRRRRFLLAFAAWGFLVSLGPVSNVIVPLKTFVADRFLYPGLLCVAAALAAFLASRRGTWRSAAMTIACGGLLGFAVLTAGRDTAWSSEMRLWQAVRADRPWNANAYQGIAYEYLAKMRIADAENAFATYLEANPFDGKSMYAMGDLFGALARGLRQVGDARDLGETNVALRRGQAHVAQIKMYRRAYEIWHMPGGLALGRGSQTMLLEMLAHWTEAGLALGSLQEARFANDRAIEIEAGGAYPAADTTEVWAHASLARRAVRLQLALYALRAQVDRSMAPELKRRVLASRAAVLRDVGLDPAASRSTLAVPLAGRLRDLLEEGARTPGYRPDARPFADLAGLLLADHDRAGAREALREGLRVLPGNRFLQAQLRALQAGPR